MGSLRDSVTLTEIVMPGSHDSGVWPAVTTPTSWSVPLEKVIAQGFDICNQARHGARWFDMRMFWSEKDRKFRAAHIPTEFLVKLHADPRLGGFGVCTQDLVEQAVKFVTDYPTEFLILRFTHTPDAHGFAHELFQFIRPFLPQGKKSPIYLSHDKCLVRKPISEFRGKVILIFGGHDFEKECDSFLGHDWFFGYKCGAKKGINCCGTFADSPHLKDIQKQVYADLFAHDQRRCDANDFHLHFVYWQLTERWGQLVGRGDIKEATTKPKGTHQALTSLCNTVATFRVLPVNVISYDFVHREQSTEIIKCNPPSVLNHGARWDA